MRGVAVILGLFVVASTYALEVPTDGSYTVLRPTAGEKTTVWELTTEEGSKMVLICSFKANSCSEASVKVFNGEKSIDHCPEENLLFLDESTQNKMSVTVTSDGVHEPVLCGVRVKKQ